MTWGNNQDGTEVSITSEGIQIPVWTGHGGKLFPFKSELTFVWIFFGDSIIS
jgi:hypothetical protein